MAGLDVLKPEMASNGNPDGEPNETMDRPRVLSDANQSQALISLVTQWMAPKFPPQSLLKALRRYSISLKSMLAEAEWASAS